jgi:hypothetical protein
MPATMKDIRPIMNGKFRRASKDNDGRYIFDCFVREAFRRGWLPEGQEDTILTAMMNAALGDDASTMAFIDSLQDADNKHASKAEWWVERARTVVAEWPPHTRPAFVRRARSFGIVVLS